MHDAKVAGAKPAVGCCALRCFIVAIVPEHHVVAAQGDLADRPAVGSNVVGAVVGGVEGATEATKATFKNERRVIRVWKTETTSDGRTIQVPVEVEVDEQGRPIEKK